MPARAATGRSPQGHYAVAQLSPWVLWPPDGLNLKQGTCGELFGYGYLPLPLTAAKKTTAGKDVPTGNHCWTLFLNTGNFKGPVTFFTPYFWSRASVDEPKLSGLFLDTRPSEPNKAVQMETQHVPASRPRTRKGDTYARVAPTSFPRGPTGDSPLVHRITAYNEGAVGRRGGLVRRRRPRPAGSHRPQGTPSSTPSRAAAGRPGGSTRNQTPRANGPPLAWRSFATPTA